MQTGFPALGSGLFLPKVSGDSRADLRAPKWFLTLVADLQEVAHVGMEGTENAVVFVIENSADYMYQLEQTLRKAALPIDLKIARYGNEAVLYLKGVGIYGDRTTYPLPRVIVLDLDLPDGSPLAVLGWIRQQTELTGVSVITTGYPGQQKLIQQARELGAIAWFPKSEFPSLISTIESLVRAGEHHHLHHAAA
jgi:CheY-like chemotaxis protein